MTASLPTDRTATKGRTPVAPAPPGPPPPAVRVAGRKPGPVASRGTPIPAAGPGTHPIVPGVSSPLGDTGAATAGEPLGEVRSPATRSWVLEIPAGTVFLTSNHRLHRMRVWEINRELKKISARLARIQKIPRIERADIWFTYLPPPKLERDRHPFASVRVEDGSALAPSGKALIDGISGSKVIDKTTGERAAGVFVDDNHHHVRWESYQRLPGTCPQGQLWMTITEVLGGQ